MDTTTMALLELQGELRIAFMRLGADPAKALDYAAEAIHLFMQSPVAGSVYREAYRAVEGQQ